ncbi:MAG: FeoA family protein [Lachnospiraceae bacterium]|nr:FeoA family protein [Lachnospiraceae bacterium]
MTLWDGENSNSYILKQIMLEEILERRLEALGLNEGTVVTIMNKKKSGAMIVKVRGTRLALGKHITSQIEVESKKEKDNE